MLSTTAAELNIIWFNSTPIIMYILEKVKGGRMGNKFAKIKEEYSMLDKEYQMISHKIQELKDISYDLMVEISDNENTIEKSKQKIAELQVLVDELVTTTEKNRIEYTDLQSEIKTLQTRQKSLATELDQKKKQVDTITNKEICQSALSANAKNSYRAILKKTTSTTPIITEFCKNKQYEFLILNANMRLPSYNSFSYIVIRANTTITGMVENIPTMTEIKSVSGKSISSVNIPRMQFLKEHILEVARRNVITKPRQIIPLSEPCPIGGQSDSNQEGYGWEWDWSGGIGDYYEGTYYGEMTGFSVIGIQINEPNYW